ncbi:hypothetical protein F2Q69_00054607 [Brassica cretica]|uniref:Uncharacterized protein n=1 Tax=Brassica cretica TaxID=69181 RepID=A0A8S9N6H1_BRACR|nr:hypothetical protein F2Q69_00054607 [Brassica cretica]
MEEATHEKSAGDLAFEAELSGDDQQEVSYVNGQGWQLKNYHPNPNVRNNQQIFWPKQDKPTDPAQSNQGQYAGYQKNYQTRAYKESEQQPADTPAVERNKEPAVGTSSPGPEQLAEAVRPIPEVVPPREYIPKFPYPVPAKATRKDREEMKCRKMLEDLTKESEQLPADTPAVERNIEPAVGTSLQGPEQPAEAVRPFPEVAPPHEYIPKVSYPVPAKATRKDKEEMKCWKMLEDLTTGMPRCLIPQGVLEEW